MLARKSAPFRALPLFVAVSLASQVNVVNAQLEEVIAVGYNF